MRPALVVVALASFALAWLLGGVAPFGRLALAVGQPGLAAALLSDPSWRGIALYRAGRYVAAAEAFSAAGPAAAFNRGNARARAGDYATALEAYDLAMALGEDPEARRNFDLVAEIYGARAIEADSFSTFGTRDEGPTAEAEIGRGQGRASGSGDEVTNSGATLGMPALQSRQQVSVRRVFDDSFIAASPRWLATLEDVPGAFLAARIYEEHKRRRDVGSGQPQEATEW